MYLNRAFYRTRYVFCLFEVKHNKAIFLITFFVSSIIFNSFKDNLRFVSKGLHWTETIQGYNRENYLLQRLRETSLSNILLRAIRTISNHFIDAVSFGLNILSLSGLFRPVLESKGRG